MRSITTAFILLSLLVPATAAQDCDGDDGYILDLPSEAPIGKDFIGGLFTPGPSLTLLFVSDGDGPTDTPFGTLCVDFPTIQTYVFPMLSGALQFRCGAPCDPTLVDLEVFMQFVAFDILDLNSSGISNQIRTVVTDIGLCDACRSDCDPATLLMEYTGKSCAASDNDQGDRAECDGDPAFEDPVHVIVTNDNGGKVYFDDSVNLGQCFLIDSSNAGQDKLESNTRVQIFSLGGDLLQELKFHTSCSKPLNRGDQYGSLLLKDVGCDGDTDCADNTSCEDGLKPATLVMRYDGRDCSATNHSQPDDKVDCDGDPAFESPVRIVASDKDGNKIWFDGEVELDGTFNVAASNAGEAKLSSETKIVISDLSGNVLQTLRFHTSCSQPLFEGDQFGSAQLLDFIGEGCDDGGGGSCADGDPQILIMQYEGRDCSASDNDQSEDKVDCDGDPAFESPVYIMATDKDGEDILFEGTVGLGFTFDIDANRVGRTKLESETLIKIFSLNGDLLQSLRFHTSCSQPLREGDVFGSCRLTEFIPE